MPNVVSDLDAWGLLAAAGEAVRARRLAEVADLEVLAQWAALHGDDPVDGWDSLLRLGGEGTPRVRDFCLGEIALARGTGVTATSNALADVLDLMHRLPRVWAVCRAGAAEVYVARRVAKLSRHLPLSVVGVVDSAIARVITTEAGGRVLAVAEAKIVEADPALHEERAEAERRRRYVGSSRTDEYGLRTVIARVEAGDAVWVEATVARVAEILTPRHPDASADEVRAIAFGWLARPAELLQLLLEHRDAQGTLEPELETSRVTAFPADLLDALQTADLSPLAPKTVLYVHLHEAALKGHPGVARVEGLGPVTLATLQSLLAGTQVTVKPVLDLSDRVRTTSYEHPSHSRNECISRRAATTGPTRPRPAAAWTTTIRCPSKTWARPGRPAPTTPGSLGRRHHRWKTHAGYRSRQSGDGRYAWLTPHGLGFLVDHHGTHPVEAKHAQLIIDAPPGVDLYPGVRIEPGADCPR